MQFTIWIFRLVCFFMLPMIEVLCLPRIERKYVIDLLASLQLNKTVMESVSGYSKSPAYLFKGTNREIQMPKDTLTKVLNTIEDNREFTFLASIKQKKKNSGVIFSIARGRKRYLELQSSGRRDELRLHYWDSKRVIVETFSYKLDDQHWHRIALSVSGGHITVYIDCMRIYERVIHPIDVGFKHKKGLTLWVGQRNYFNYYQGILQDVKLIARPYGFLEQCPFVDSQCPTCGQFHALESKFDQLAKYVQVLETNLKTLQEKVNSREECECMKACVVNNTRYRDGESWSHKCDRCTCRGGKVECKPDCPKPKCQFPVKMEGQCCPVCHPKCFHDRRYFEHGRGVMKLINRDNVKSCLNCTCKAGSMNCVEVSMEKICPPVNCSRIHRYREPDQCCEKCMGTDFCSDGNDCHPNATCYNLDTMYQCKCKPGFKGDGKHCEDEDECSVVGGSHHAHHCQTNTQCINTVGSYSCQCLSGFYQVDALSCEDLDECQSGQHNCGPDSVCVNTEGSYTCRCKRGYVRKDDKCLPICHEDCQNGGKCVEPDVCHCRHGFKGKLCEIDIDECKLGISSCYPNSECVNLPGTYYCRCKAGYQSKKEDNKYGRLCRDINECETSRDTCHFSRSCNNTDGSYKCLCHAESSNCHSNFSSLCDIDFVGCIYQHKEYSNGTIFESPGSSCEICHCLEGLVTCHKTPCDCSNLIAVNSNCCPHCSSMKCNDNTTVYNNGQRWHNYQCEICECLEGEIDCWHVSCPELSCDKTIQRPGECCPRCEDDNPCSRKTPPRKRRRICKSKGKRYREGQRWRLLDSSSSDDCTVCQCKGGHTCCSYMPKYCRRTTTYKPRDTTTANYEVLSYHRQTRSTETVTPSLTGNDRGHFTTNIFRQNTDLDGQNVHKTKEEKDSKSKTLDRNSVESTVVNSVDTALSQSIDSLTETVTFSTITHNTHDVHMLNRNLNKDKVDGSANTHEQLSANPESESNLDSVTQTTSDSSPNGESDSGNRGSKVDSSRKRADTEEYSSSSLKNTVTNSINSDRVIENAGSGDSERYDSKTTDYSVEMNPTSEHSRHRRSMKLLTSKRNKIRTP